MGFMRRILNTYKYGSAKTKLVLSLAILSGIATGVFVVVAIVLRFMLFFFAAVVCLFITISLAQTFFISGGEDRNISIHNHGDSSTWNEYTLVETSAHNMEESYDIKEEAGQEVIEEEAVEEIEEARDGIEEEAVEEIEEAGDGIEESDARNKWKRKKQKKRSKEKKQKKRNKVKEKKAIEADSKENTVQEDEDFKDSPEDEALMNVVQINEETIKNFDRKKIKKYMHKYRVKRDYRLAMVDHSEKLKISQTPAYLWVTGKEFHMLLIEEEPRHICMPIFKLREVTYLKKQPANEDIDYAAFKGKNMLADLFRPYLPDYTHSTVVDDLTAYKNLYGITPDIYFTNRSAKNIFDLLNLDFRVDDKVTMSPKVNYYFKDAYKANIMLRDNVIDANGYADKISKVLDSMARSSISYNEFKETLNLMTKNKLITQEFAMYYMDVRNKTGR